MSVLMTKAKAQAIESAKRDRHLISDAAERERIISTEPPQDRDRLRKVSESRKYLDARMKAGK